MVLTRRLAAVLVLTAGGAALAASEAKESLSPALAPIVAAERAFAKRAGEVGIRQSFMEYFADDAISFAPDPGNAQQRFKSRPAPKEPPPVLLEWGPEMAEVNADGTMGWTTGPSLFTDKTGKRPPHHGYYFSVWKKQADGQFKVAIDVGTDSPSPTPIPTVAVAAGGGKADKPDKKPTTFADVKARDEEFCKAAAAGAQKAYAAALAPDARMHLDGTLPAVGAKATKEALAKLDGVMSCTPQGGDAAAGLGYVYGSWERRAKAGGDVAEKGYYARVWRQQGGGWKLAADVRTLVAPQ